jgi:uncharacterized protein YndB with AHSA1/START domain
MTSIASETRSVVMEREVAFPPEKIWRALTQPHLIAEWLMKNDFLPAKDHRFTLRGDWGSVDCKVLAVEPHKVLSYTWDAMGLESIVTWTLTPTSAWVIWSKCWDGTIEAPALLDDDQAPHRKPEQQWKA